MLLQSTRFHLKALVLVRRSLLLSCPVLPASNDRDRETEKTESGRRRKVKRRPDGNKENRRLAVQCYTGQRLCAVLTCLLSVIMIALFGGARKAPIEGGLLFHSFWATVSFCFPLFSSLSFCPIQKERFSSIFL